MKIRERIEYIFPNTEEGKRVSKQFARRRKEQDCLYSYHPVGDHIVVVCELEFELEDEDG